MVLVFDLEERLASFTGIPAPYAALPGRVIAGLLAGQGIGLGVNLGVAPSSMLLSPEAVDWLAQTLENGPVTLEARPLQFDKPAALPEALLAAWQQQHALVAEGPARYRLTLEAGRLADLLQALAAQHCEVLALAYGQQNLEHVFMQLTQRALRDKS